MSKSKMMTQGLPGHVMMVMDTLPSFSLLPVVRPQAKQD